MCILQMHAMYIHQGTVCILYMLILIMHMSRQMNRHTIDGVTCPSSTSLTRSVAPVVAGCISSYISVSLSQFLYKALLTICLDGACDSVAFFLCLSCRQHCMMSIYKELV